MIRDLFRNPSSFEGDPRGFLKNQSLHILLFGILPAGLGLCLALWWPWALILVVGVALLLYGLWELGQQVLHDAEGWDCLADFGVVLQGHLIVLLGWPVLLLSCVLLASGALRRSL